MSVLTKTFVVLLVVLSLLLSAGVVVFAGHAEDFRHDLATQAKTNKQLTVERDQSRSLLAALEANYTAATHDRDLAVADAQKQFLDAQTAKVVSAGQLADAASSQQSITTSLNTTTAALTASETSRNAQAGIIASTRANNDDLKSKNSDLNLRVSDLTNKLDVITRQFTNATEQIAQLRSENTQLNGQLGDRGIKPDSATVAGGTGIGAPPITSKVIHTDKQNGIEYATISVGSKDQVIKGMKFQLVDRANAKYLGELTVESIDESQATGKIEGPGIADVHPETEARTQL